MYHYRSFVIYCMHLSSLLIVGNFILSVRLSSNWSLVSWNFILSVRLESNKQNQMKKINSQPNFFSSNITKIISRSNTLTILFAFFLNKLKRRFKVQSLNDFLFAFNMNLSKENISILIKELRMFDFLIAPGEILPLCFWIYANLKIKLITHVISWFNPYFSPPLASTKSQSA